MQAGSAASLAEAKARLAQTLAAPKSPPAGPAEPGEPVEPGRFAAELFALVDALDADKALPRALTNPNRAAEPKQRLVRQAMAGHLPAAVDFAAWACALRWSKEGDLADALEELAFDAALAGAAQAGRLERVEAELFSLDAALGEQRELRTALAEAAAPPAARAKLVRRVFGPAVSPDTLALAERVAAHPRGRGVRHSLAFLGGLVAARRQRLVAIVTAARPLSQAQQDALARALSGTYGRAVQLGVAVDPALVGGARVRVGDDVLDGALATRFAQARRLLAA
ncbi:MAG: F0F1 ATP synthase subunit delta [Bifidobacteriaceae bacterium]|jgi:F-type H+-transporting ATPase subunit delta|nr:F0F1 ATP synthase subunit delta [Bifidobacteriaceae bacterium]